MAMFKQKPAAPIDVPNPASTDVVGGVLMPEDPGPVVPPHDLPPAPEPVLQLSAEPTALPDQPAQKQTRGELLQEAYREVDSAMRPRLRDYNCDAKDLASKWTRVAELTDVQLVSPSLKVQTELEATLAQLSELREGLKISEVREVSGAVFHNEMLHATLQKARSQDSGTP